MLPVVFVRTISRATACAIKKLPATLTSSIRRNSDTGKSVAGPLRDKPAQATSPLSG